MPSKTRSKKEGSVYQRAADGMWCASVELPSTTGKRRRKVVVARTKSQVMSKLNALKGELRQHGDLPTEQQTLGTWMDYWFTNIKAKTLRPGTMSSYRSKVGYIKEAIGTVRLDKLTPAHVRKVHDHILAAELSSSTASQTHAILSNALKYAEQEGRVHRNVAKLADKPQVAHTTLDALSGADGVRLLQTVAGERLGSRWAAALLTGARQGELIGLEIDRVTDYIDLSWKLERINWLHGCKPKCDRIRGVDCPQRKLNASAGHERRHLEGGLYLSRPKSRAGYRIIPLVDPLKSIIRRRIEISLTEPNPHNLVWTADPKKTRHGDYLPLDGSPIDPRIDNERWHDALARAGVPDVRLHDARHTTATLLYDAGVKEADIVRILGHSKAVTSRAYRNLGDYEQLSEAMMKLSAQLALPE